MPSLSRTVSATPFVVLLHADRDLLVALLEGDLPVLDVLEADRGLFAGLLVAHRQVPASSSESAISHPGFNLTMILAEAMAGLSWKSFAVSLALPNSQPPTMTKAKERRAGCRRRRWRPRRGRAGPSSSAPERGRGPTAGSGWLPGERPRSEVVEEEEMVPIVGHGAPPVQSVERMNGGDAITGRRPGRDLEGGGDPSPDGLAEGHAVSLGGGELPAIETVDVRSPSAASAAVPAVGVRWRSRRFGSGEIDRLCCGYNPRD